jgi:hypothetical protein
MSEPKSETAKVLEEIVDGSDNVVDLVTRQQKRAQERAAAKDAQSVVPITKERLAALMRARTMLAALVRRTGRVRISRAEVEIGAGSRVEVKVQDNGDLVVSFVEG